jgi:hypothetical protein
MGFPTLAASVKPVSTVEKSANRHRLRAGAAQVRLLYGYFEGNET